MPKDTIRHYPFLMMTGALRALSFGIRACAERGDTARIMQEYLPLLDDLAEEIPNIREWYDAELKEMGK